MSGPEIIAQLLQKQPSEYIATFKHAILFSEYGYKKMDFNIPFRWVWFERRLWQEDIHTLQHLLDLCNSSQ